MTTSADSPIVASDLANAEAVRVGAEAYRSALYLSDHARAARPGVPEDAVRTALAVALDVRLGANGWCREGIWDWAVRLATGMLEGGLSIEAALVAALSGYRWRRENRSAA